MFNLIETIAAYNQINNKKIKFDKTWGLTYLQPKRLAFLNQVFQLIEGSVYYNSPFATDRNTLRTELAKTKKHSISIALPTFQNIVQQLKTDQSTLQRLNWEECLNRQLNNKTFWDNCLKQVDKQPPIQAYQALHAQWIINQPFQYHSSEGLLFLLDVVVEYHYQFTKAEQELKKKQNSWLPFLRLPHGIAETYRLFLVEQLNYFDKLRADVLEALLLRLKIAEQQNQVTCDDVSYALAKEIQYLGLPLVASLPKCQRLLEPATFNRIHRAIEKHANFKQRHRLYQLAWYKYGELNAEKICVITLSQQRLLLPKALRHLLPNRYSKLKKILTIRQHLAFLESQQALLAQMALSFKLDKLSLNSMSITHPTLQSLTKVYQLLQQSFQLIDQQSIRWWQWQQKIWKKTWSEWITKQLQKTQTGLSDFLTEYYKHLKKHNNLLNQPVYQKKLQAIIQATQTISDKDRYEHRHPKLITLLKNLSALLEEKKYSNSDFLILSFKQDLLDVLQAYIQYNHDQGETIPEHRRADFNYLWNLLMTSEDVIQLRAGFLNRYQKMQPVLFKWIKGLDSSFLRRRLKAVLENPEYSLERLERAAMSKFKKHKFQENYSEPDEALRIDNQSSPINLAETFKGLKTNLCSSDGEKIEQLEERTQILIKHNECGHVFFNKIPKNESGKEFNFFTKLLA